MTKSYTLSQADLKALLAAWASERGIVEPTVAFHITEPDRPGDTRTVSATVMGEER